MGKTALLWHIKGLYDRPENGMHIGYVDLQLVYDNLNTCLKAACGNIVCSHKHDRIESWRRLNSALELIGMRAICWRIKVKSARPFMPSGVTHTHTSAQ